MIDPVKRPPIDVDKVMVPDVQETKVEDDKSTATQIWNITDRRSAVGKHSNGKRRPKNWRSAKKKARKTAKVSRRRNRR